MWFLIFYPRLEVTKGGNQQKICHECHFQLIVMVKVRNIANKYWIIKLLSFFSFISNVFPSIYPCLGFFYPLVEYWFMKMHERIRRKVCLTYSSDKSWKSSILCIRFVENVDLVAFSKDFLLLNNRKQTMRTKKVCPKLSDLEIWYEVSPYRSKSTGQVSLETYLLDIKCFFQAS